MASKNTFPTLAGISGVVAACFSFLIGLFGLVWYIDPPFVYSGYVIFSPNRDPAFLIMGLLGVFGFALGLQAGIFSMKRNNHSVVVVGLLLMIVAPFIPVVVGLLNQAGDSCFYPQCNNGSIKTTLGVLIIPGIPIIILGTLALLSLTLNQNKFAKPEEEAESSELIESSQAAPVENPTGWGRGSLMASQKASLRIAGIFSFVAACITLLTAYAGFYTYLNPALDFSGFPPRNDPVFLILGLQGLLGFAFGLAAGKFTLGKSHYSLVITGLLIIILAPIIPYIISWLSTLPFVEVTGCAPSPCTYYPRDFLGYILLLFGTPAIILSTLSLFLIMLKKNEFTD